MSYTPTGDSTLYFVNPCNKDWQNYIFAQENKSLNALGYDGWHGDTVGDWEEMKNIRWKLFVCKRHLYRLFK